MKKIMNTFFVILRYGLGMALIMPGGCNTGKEKKIVVKTGKLTSSKYKKPESNYQDSLQIKTTAAVFYHPDSLQLLKIKEGMDSSVFDGTMHEFFYQIRNARIVLKKTWPLIKISEAKNYRYLVFHKKDGTREIIDLNNKNDAYGMFIFDPKKSPRLIDMTNIDTEVSLYLKE